MGEEEPVVSRDASRGHPVNMEWAAEVGVLAVRCGSLEPSPGPAGRGPPLPYVALAPGANIVGASDSTRASVTCDAALHAVELAGAASREARRPLCDVGPWWVTVCSTRTARLGIRAARRAVVLVAVRCRLPAWGLRNTSTLPRSASVDRSLSASRAPRVAGTGACR